MPPWIKQEEFVRAVAGSRSAEEVGLRPALRQLTEAEEHEVARLMEDGLTRLDAMDRVIMNAFAVAWR